MYSIKSLIAKLIMPSTMVINSKSDIVPPLSLRTNEDWEDNRLCPGNTRKGL